MNNIIGQVLITQREPAKPYEFWCWLQNNSSLQIEIGTVLVAEGDNGERALVLVEDMQSTSAASEPEEGSAYSKAPSVSITANYLVPNTTA